VSNMGLRSSSADDTDIRSLGIDPGASNDINVGILYAGSATGNLYRSNNNGVAWNRVETGLTQPPSKINDILLLPNPMDMEFIVFAGTDNGLLRGESNGTVWEGFTAGLESNLDILTVTSHPSAPMIVFLGTGAGVFRSTDRGETWMKFGLQFNLPTFDLLVDPNDQSLIYAGTEDGVYGSMVTQPNWRPLNENIREVFIQALIAGPQMPTVLLAGSLRHGAFRSRGPELDEFGISEDDLETLDDAAVAALAEGLFAALTPAQLAKLPPESACGLSSAQLAQLSGASAAGFSPDQFRCIPDNALAGFHRDHFGMLPVDAIATLNSARLAMIDADEFQQSDARDVARWLLHLESDDIRPDNVRNLLPPDWDIDMDSGELKPPPGTNLSLRPVPPPPNRPPNLKLLNDRPDLNKTFGLGGTGGTTVLEGLNQGLTMANLPDFRFMQDDEGFISVVGSGAAEGIRFAFVPDIRRIMQDEGNNPAGVIVNEENQFVVITPQGLRIPLIPAPRDPDQLATLAIDAFGENTTVSIAEAGDVTIALDAETRRTLLFAPEVIPASVISEMGLSPGFNFTNPTARNGQSLGVVVFADGTGQTMYPYIPAPDTFETTLLALSPLILSVTFNLFDGTAVADVAGVNYALIPAATSAAATLADGEVVLPT
ncbi:MAG: hypothetical protein AAF512_25560, partial [Pseudomonadota bacterium]